ncbi:MAG: hypothetical protein Q8R29_00165 [bacterium]|nr:hypothetical protein [bacterium]
MKKLSAKSHIQKKAVNFRKDDWDCLGFMVVYYIIWTALIVSTVVIVIVS